jgi:predicted site-specific integrase-resolvase
MPIKHLRQAEVAQRWNVSPRTLERWRWTGQGPRFLKVGGRVVYRIEDIEAYEARQLRTSTVQPEAPAQAGAR